MGKQKFTTLKVRLDAETGEFIPAEEAERPKKTAIVEKAKRPAESNRKPKKQTKR